jgi:hypothetical protein
MSSDSSISHPVLPAGSGEVAPCSLTLVKQPLAVVHAGRPNVERYVARLLAAPGSS